MHDPRDGFTALRLDKLGVLTSIAYIGKEAVEEQNWSCLIGQPEAALNNLASRHDEGVLTDLPSFLRQNWAMAIYHDRFTEFRAALRQEMESDDDFKRVMAEVRRTPATQITPSEFMGMLPEGKRNLVRARLLDYVQTNQNHLDMYLVPSSSVMKKMEAAKAA